MSDQRETVRVPGLKNLACQLAKATPTGKHPAPEIIEAVRAHAAALANEKKS